jgi:DHA2 family multidrug resistance protein
MLVGRIIGKVPNRVLMLIGFSLLATSSFWLGQINLQVSMRNVIWPSVLNGVAISFIFVPLTTSTMGHLRQEQMGNATGIYNLMRNLGGSIGIALVGTFLDRRAQVHQALMVRHMTPYDQPYMEQLAVAQHALAAHADPVTAHLQAQQLLYGKLVQQASLWSFVEDFRLFGLFCLVCLPLILLFKHVRAGSKSMAAH